MGLLKENTFSINFHLEMNNPEDVTALENSFAEEVKKRGDDFKFFKDQFGEHPEERANNEEITEKLTGVTTLNEIYAAIKEKVPKFEPLRIPTNQEKAPVEANFDQIVTMLKDTTASCPVIFNCQVLLWLLCLITITVSRCRLASAEPPPPSSAARSSRSCS